MIFFLSPVVPLSVVNYTTETYVYLFTTQTHVLIYTLVYFVPRYRIQSVLSTTPLRLYFVPSHFQLAVALASKRL